MSPAPDGSAVQPAPAGPMDLHVGYHLRRASAVVLGDLARSLSPLGLTIAEAAVLRLTSEAPDITQSDLGRILGIKRANMAPLAAGLIERGLVGRGLVNGRSQGLRATELGEGLADQVRACMAAQEARVLPDLTGPERQALIALLSRIWKPSMSPSD